MCRIEPLVRVLTCEAGVMFNVFTRVIDTCDMFTSAVARVSDIAVSYTSVSRRC